MKWRTQFHKRGETRERVVFAWWPIPTDDGYTRWLTDIVVTERWEASPDSYPGAMWGERLDDGYWQAVRAMPYAPRHVPASPTTERSDA